MTEAMEDAVRPAEADQERFGSRLDSSRRTASRSASRHRQRLLSGHLSPVRGETVVDSVEQLVVRHRIAGIQRSFTQVLKESSEKRSAAEATTRARRPSREPGEQSIVNRILKEVGVRVPSATLLPEQLEGEDGRQEETKKILKETAKQQSWYQKAASKIGLKTADSEKTDMTSSEATKNIPNVSASKEKENAGITLESPEVRTKEEKEGFLSRERTESVCSDNLPDLEDRLEAGQSYLDMEVGTNITTASTEEDVQDMVERPPLLLVREMDKSGLFLTSFDHDEDEEDVNEEDHEVMGCTSEAVADHFGGHEEVVSGSPPQHLEVILKEQVSHLLEAVLQPQGASKQRRNLSLALHREGVEESLVKQITDVISRTLNDHASAVADVGPSAGSPVLIRTASEKDEKTDVSMALEGRDMSMALVRGENKSDCECCEDGDLLEQENVYDVFDLRQHITSCRGGLLKEVFKFRLFCLINFFSFHNN